MSESILARPYFHDETAAYAELESIVWPNGPVCPHCGATDRIAPLTGKSHRIGLKKCYHCRQQFTVKVGTVFEQSHVPLHKWLQAAYLMCSSKKGISSNQLHRTLGVTLKTAWFMSHRIREAMKTGNSLFRPPVGGGGGTVEAEETYFGTKEGRNKGRPGPGHKHAVFSLVERGGEVRSFHVKDTKASTLRPIMAVHIARDAHLMTDEARVYTYVGHNFASHGTVAHGQDEYVRGNVHTNTIEGFFSVFKRGMKGVYQHCGERHLKRYLAEFDFRYNARAALGVNDSYRTEKALRGIVGKRLIYRDSLGA